MMLVLMLLALIALSFYVKVKSFTLRGPIPGVSPHFLFGNLIQTGILLHGVSLPQALSAWKERFGDIFQLWVGPTRLIAVNNVIDVEHVFTHRQIYDQGDIYVKQFSIVIPHGLISSKGAKYKRHAALTLPLFRRGKIVANFDLIVDSVQQLLARWRERPAGHVYLDMAVQAQDLLLTIFGLIAFDYDLETLKKEKSAQNNQLTGALQDFLSTFNTMLFLPTSVAKFYFQFSPRFRRAQRIIEGHFDRMIEQELTENEQFRAERKRTSLIASLVSSLQENETREASKLEEDRKGLSRSELLDEMRLFLLAGFETTSTALTWFIHLLSKHPEVQQKIKLELNNENETSDLSSDRLDSFVYLDCVIKEVFRFCPPINGTVRTLTEDDRLPESATQLFKGDQVLIPFHNLSHDPRYWSIDPHRFYPERFLTEDKAYHPYALIPFGSGHRQCIGQDLARFELKVIAATLMQHVTFGDAGPMINAGGQLSNLTITPKHLAVTVRFDQKRC